jgi:hypothetical protein
VTAVPVVQLRDEAERSIQRAIDTLLRAFPVFGPGTFDRGPSWVLASTVSPGTEVEFEWGVRDKHFIKLIPRERASDPSDQHPRSLPDRGLRPSYGIERLFEYGGGSGSYLLYRSDPTLGVEELIRRVPELLQGDWSQRAEIDRTHR